MIAVVIMRCLAAIFAANEVNSAERLFSST